MGTNFRNYILLIIGLAFSAFPFFMGVSKIIGLGFLALLVLINIFKNRSVYNDKIFIALFVIYLIAVLQSFAYGGVTPAIVYKPLFIIFIPFLLYKIMGINFFDYLFNIVYYSAIITLILWGAQNIFPSVDIFFNQIVNDLYPYSWDAWPRSFILFTIGQFKIKSLGIYRNSGIFHEPGGYAQYLMLAIIYNTIKTDKPFSKKNVLLITALLTTFSTVAYVMLFIYAGYWIYVKNKSTFLRVINISAFLVLSVFIFNNAEFMSGKIESRYEMQQERLSESNSIVRGRFFSLYKTSVAALKYPLLGKGFLTTNRYEGVTAGSSFGYGIPGVSAKFGFIIGIIYIILFYKGIKYLSIIFGNYNKSSTIIYFIIIQIGLLTQIFTYDLAFMMIPILGIMIDKKLLVYLSKIKIPV